MRAFQSLLKKQDADDVCTAAAALKQEPNREEKTHASDEDFAYPGSFAAVGRSLFEDPIFSDVIIEGTDGMRLCAHRLILASRSPVFKNLLAGQFSEAHSPVVRLGFEGVVLKMILEYCYTDEIRFTPIETGEHWEESMIDVAMNLSSAADYFALPKLCDKVVDLAMTHMTKNPLLAWSFLVAAETSSWSHLWIARCLDIISSHADVCLAIGDGRLRHVSRWALEQVTADNNIAADEATLFSLIASWETTSVAGAKKRKTEAADLVAKHIRLEGMTASALAAVVEPSGLVTSNQVLQAYKSLATQAETTGIGAVTAFRRGGVWETSKNINFQSTTMKHGTELLKCQPMRTGKFRWSIEVTSYCVFVHLGLARSSFKIDRTMWLGDQQRGWVYASDGRSNHPGSGRKREDLPQFTAGDTVTFTLDLSGPACLKACVNNGEEETIFDHDALTLNEGDAYSFVPAVSLIAPGAVRFRGFLSV